MEINLRKYKCSNHGLELVPITGRVFAFDEEKRTESMKKVKHG